MSSETPYDTALCVVIQTIRVKNKMSTSECQRMNVLQVVERSSVPRSADYALTPALIKVIDIVLLT